jgi:hypothetical protein
MTSDRVTTEDLKGRFGPQNITRSEYRIDGCTILLDDPVCFNLIT